MAHELAQLAPEMAALLPSLNLEVLHDFGEFNRASFGLEELHDGLDVDDHSSAPSRNQITQLLNASRKGTTLESLAHPAKPIKPS